MNVIKKNYPFPTNLLLCYAWFKELSRKEGKCNEQKSFSCLIFEKKIYIYITNKIN